MTFSKTGTGYITTDPYGATCRARALILFAALLIFTSSPALSEFEAYNLFGAGAVSASMGGASVGSDRDTLDFLVNPALITRYDAARYSLSISSYKDKFGFSDYKQSIISMAKARKGYSLIIDDDGGITRDMFTFTAALPYGGGKKTAFGVNLAGFRYSTVPIVFPSPATGTTPVSFPSDNGSGFTLDVGVFKDFGKGIQAGLAIENLLSSGSETETLTARRDLELPRMFNLSIRYPVMKSADLLLAYKSYSYSSGSSNSDRGDNLIFVGGEYRLDNPISARGGFMSESAYSTETDARGNQTSDNDRSAPMGLGYVTDRFNVGLAILGYHNTFEKANSVLISYKKDESKPWKEPLEPEPAPPEIPVPKPEVKYEQPLPPAAKVEPSEEEKSLAGKQEESKDAKGGYEEEKETEPARPRTKIASFSVDPKIMLVPKTLAERVQSVAGHWAQASIDSLAKIGFYNRERLESFSPGGKVPREEFYRLLFLTQITRFFDAPAVVLFNTPYPVSAGMWLSSPLMETPVLLQEGTYDRAGQKRLVINRDLLLKNEILAGKYKLTLKVTGDKMRPEELEDYITVLDTSMDFSTLLNLENGERRNQITALKRNMETLGINVDYLDGLEKTGPITRLEALRGLFAAAAVQLPSEFEKDTLFKDIWQLPEEDQAAVFLASRGMDSLGGYALMNGYPDNTFRPEGQVTGAEAAALIDRFRDLKQADFEPPYQVAIKPQTFKTEIIASVPPPPTAAGPKKGMQPVSVSQLISDIQVPSRDAKFIITIGSYASSENADNAVGILTNNGYTPQVYAERLGTIVAHHIVVGRYDSEAAARAALMKMKPVPEFDFKVVSIYGGATVALAPYSAAPAGKLPPRPKPPRKDAEGSMHLEGSSFIPWNLIRNLGDFDPHTAESTPVIIQ